MTDIYVPDHNRYLKAVCSEIRNNGITDELVHSLYIELKFAQLLSSNYRGVPLSVKRDGKVYLILYNDLDDMYDDFPSWSNSNLPFSWYIEILKSPYFFYLEEGSSDIHRSDGLESFDGIMLDMNHDEFIIEGELLERLNEQFGVDVYSADEIGDMYENLNNERLEGLLNRYPLDWDEIIREIGNSTILFMVGPEECGNLGRFDYFFDHPFGFNREFSLSTFRDCEGHLYALVVNFKTAVDHVLNFGLTGIGIATPDGEVYMSRQLLVDKYEMIEKYCNDERLKHAHECIFKV